MEVYVYLDESGSIHKNSNTKYFAVGGYFCFFSDRNKIISTYKRINKSIKDIRNIPLNTEIKSYDMKDNEKREIFATMQRITSFCGFSIIFNKSLMKKEVIESNIFFNYAVKILIKNCIIPLLSANNIKFIMSIDNRNIKVGDLKNLENYLRTEFCLENYNFSVKYYDSATNYGIQLADLIVNTFYNMFKNKNIIQNVLSAIDMNKFRISLFPQYEIIGRSQKIAYNIYENH